VSCATTASSEETNTEPEIEGVEIADKTDAASSDLADGLANHPPSVIIFKSRAHLDRLALDVDRLRVESYYHSIGFFEAEVAEANVRPGKNGRVIVHFDVDEGAPAIVSSVVIEGLPSTETSTRGAVPTEAELRALTEIQDGERFDYGAYSAAKEKLRARLYAAGYASAAVKGTVEVAKKTDRVRVRFTLTPGPRAIFGDTEIEKTTKLPEASIRARIPWEKGSPFDPRAFKAADMRMSELSLIGSVRYELATEADPETPTVHVIVSDTAPHEVRLGAGAGISTTNYDIHLRAGYLQRNLFDDPLLTFRADMKPALGVLRGDEKKITETLAALGEIQRDDLFIPRLRGIAGGAGSIEQYEVYSTAGGSAYVALDRPLFIDAFHVSTRARMTLTRVHAALSETDQHFAGIASPEVLFTLENALTLDLRDDVLSPKHGAYFDLKVELGRLVTIPTASYIKVTPEARGYLPLGTERLVLAARVRAGAAFPVDGFLPITQRYFAGGSESQRGFGRRLLSPMLMDTNGNTGPVGGAALFDGSIELRLDLFKLFGNELGIVGFFDAGDVTPKLRDLDLTHLYYAAGPGLRYRTPVGPIRFDVGFRLNRLGSNVPVANNDLNRMGNHDIPAGSGFTIQFSLGEAF
jgi:translocation and assembly module TamA